MDNIELGFDLDTIGFQWVKRCLKEGLHIAPALSTELGRLDGKVVVLGAHGELPHESADRLQWSVLQLDVLDLQDSATALIDLLKRVNTEFSEIAVVIENIDLRPHDPAAQRLLATNRPNVVVADEGIYTIYDASSFDDPEKLIIGYNIAARSHVLNAFIMRKSASVEFVKWVEDKDMESLAAALVGTIHEVYDGEGYAVWLRANNTQEQ